ncbi:Z protein [CAS virus]|uniref:Z protein n=1 Tax=CAS virus TaxID=1223561 RepID=J7H5K5_9VIRU|nr:Z protein [CAS virus]AFP93549.1 Z protein [CAS virus]AKH48972.1 Z protein [unidentified Reptarenavirus]AKH48974.1 Z protein [unidentified Reptarenavirus]AKH48976.1 Z protein [unidentified Reptarenavirus]
MSMCINGTNSIGISNEVVLSLTLISSLTTLILLIINTITMFGLKALTLKKRLSFCTACGKNSSLVKLPCKHKCCIQCPLANLKCPICYEPCLWCEKADGSLESLSLMKKNLQELP